MSLYDDFDTIKNRSTTEKVAGWSSGIKLLQSQLQLKKAATTQPKREQLRKTNQVLAPVIDLKSKKDDENIFSDGSPLLFPVSISGKKDKKKPITSSILGEYDWGFDDEYDPMQPNDYEKMVKELRNMRDREEQKQEEKDLKRERKRKTRFADSEESFMPVLSTLPAVGILNCNSTLPITPQAESGFAGNWHSDDSDEFTPESPQTLRTGGVAIAPPPSLQESSPSETELLNAGLNRGPLAGISYGASSVAAKIMAKYGFREGQGLGKKEQGMSIALQVEKTSKRGGRIIHEKEIMPPPPPVSDSIDNTSNDATLLPTENKPEPSITEIMRSPSKVVLLRNMVGPGEVDDDLEPEVKDECNTKYGEVIKVIIFEISTAPNDEAVRIFVEFKRIESAIKAVVDLNGRYFGGRNVKAGFYNAEKFESLKLNE